MPSISVRADLLTPEAVELDDGLLLHGGMEQLGPPRLRSSDLCLSVMPFRPYERGRDEMFDIGVAVLSTDEGIGALGALG